MHIITVSDLLSIIKIFDCLFAESILMKSHCIFDNPENDCFLWVSPDNDIFINFYRKDNIEIKYDSGEIFFYIEDEYGISFRIDLKMLKVTEKETD